MPKITVYVKNGRFKDSLKQVFESCAVLGFEDAFPYSGFVKIHFFKQDGTPWMPTPLTAHAKDLFDTKFDRGDILDRAADMATRAYWSPTHTNLNGYFEWAQHQREHLHKAIISWTMPPTLWDRL